MLKIDIRKKIIEKFNNDELATFNHIFYFAHLWTFSASKIRYPYLVKTTFVRLFYTVVKTTAKPWPP